MSRGASLALPRFFAFVFAVALGGVAACSAPETEAGIERDAGVFEDLGSADANAQVRAVVALPVRNRTELDGLARDLYDPSSPEHRRFLDAAALDARFLPLSNDVERTRAWATSHGLEVGFVAANRLMIELRGSVRAFNDALVTTLHAYHHRSREQRVYGTPGGIQLGGESGISALLTLDEPTDGQAAPDDAVATPSAPSSTRGYLPNQIADAYGFSRLADAKGGEGITIALATGGGLRASDVRAFFTAFGVDRSEPDVREVAGPPSFRGLESTMLVEWAGVLAPKSKLVVFQGADTRISSTLLAFNEAIASHEAQVVTFSNSRHETSEPKQTREMFDLSSELGAVSGITVIAASGDTAEPDIPATCPFVTAVGGTTLLFEGTEGATIREEAWGRTGSGSSTFAQPEWQKGVASGFRGRVVPDVALNAGAPYLVLFEGKWDAGGGTSLAAPVFASLVAVVDAGRLASGRSPLGFLNPSLYRDDHLAGAFRDVTVGGTREHAASAGWDAVSGWGAPMAVQFAQVTLDRLPH